MRILAVIPARGGSKRLPRKNLKLLGGIPLIAWTIEAARDSQCFVDVLLSTDDPCIAEVGREYGASVPWLRPAELATDTASSVDVVIHALDGYERDNGPVEGVMLLQPTSPFRSSALIRRAVNAFIEGEACHPLVSVSPAATHPAWCFRTTTAGIEPFLGWKAIGLRSQDLEQAWTLNGVIYAISPEQLRRDRAFVSPDSKPLFMDDDREALDIDTPVDWEVALEMLRLEAAPKFCASNS